MSRRWGVWYRGLSEYESEAETRRQLAMAQMDVPAYLVVNDGDGWRNAESGMPVGPMELDHAVNLVERAGSVGTDEMAAAYRLIGVVDGLKALIERRKRYRDSMADRAIKAIDRGNVEQGLDYQNRSREAAKDIFRLEQVLNGSL